MAQRWEVSSDQTVFTFTLRENARFHDGRPVTAEDFKYSWERALHPATESPVARTYLGDIVGADETADGRTEDLEALRCWTRERWKSRSRLSRASRLWTTVAK